ncbi:MAG: response regulator transcription factor [Bacteriovoracaceae bacterium]
MNKGTTIQTRIPVWIVDDNRNFCKLLAATLNLSKTIQCDVCLHSTSSAYKTLSSRVNPPAVLLLDIKMPEQSGLDSIEQIRRLSPATIILMLTAVNDEQQIKTALQRGASGYLLKTSSPVDIIRGIESAVRGGSPLDPMITKKILSMLMPEKETLKNSHGLSRRQREILQCVAKGLSMSEIARTLNISFYTVETHIRNIYHKMDVHSLHSLVAKAYSEHLID